MKIGFFDSGVGGLTVLSKALKYLPEEDYIYYADCIHTPYGTKPKETVKQYILNGVEFIASKGIKALVVACNTATSIAIDDLRSRYDFPIIGMEPAVKPAVEKCCKDKRVLVMATHLTLSEEKFKKLLYRVDTNHVVDFMPMTELVTFAEQCRLDAPEALEFIRERLSSLDIEKYGTIVLGCTHFPYFKKVIKAFLPEEVDIIDGSDGTVRNLARMLEEIGKTGGGRGNIEFYDSGIKAAKPEELEKFKYLLGYLD